MPKLNARYRSLLYSTLMSAGLSVVINLVATGINCATKRCGAFWISLIQGTALGFLIGVPTAMALVPVVTRIVNLLVDVPTQQEIR